MKRKHCSANIKQQCQNCYKLVITTKRAADSKHTCYPSIHFGVGIINYIYHQSHPDNNINYNFSFQLQDDFLLRHYDKGPCKNKLGHSRASVIWHRTQVIGIFAGFGILLLVASPLLLLAAPCIVCCKCRVCSGSSKLDTEDEMQEESAS